MRATEEEKARMNRGTGAWIDEIVRRVMGSDREAPARPKILHLTTGHERRRYCGCDTSSPDETPRDVLYGLITTLRAIRNDCEFLLSDEALHSDFQPYTLRIMRQVEYCSALVDELQKLQSGFHQLGH